MTKKDDYINEYGEKLTPQQIKEHDEYWEALEKEYIKEEEERGKIYALNDIKKEEITDEMLDNFLKFTQ